MAKVSKKPKAKLPVKKRKAPVKALAHASHEDDGLCGCSVPFTDADATPDADLPIAKGGVEVISAKRRR